MKVDRRTVLSGAGVAIELTLVDALTRRAVGVTRAVKRSMVRINMPLGVHRPGFFPERCRVSEEWAATISCIPTRNSSRIFAMTSR